MLTSIYLFVILYLGRVITWLPDPAAKIVFEKDDNVIEFIADGTVKQHLKFLDQSHDSILIGARNAVYNLNLNNLKENKHKRIEWKSNTANQELCCLKGKSVDDCQNYVRIYAKLPNGKYLICGTNSFKPLCRTYSFQNNEYHMEEEYQKKGVCPFDPTYNSTTTFDGEHLYAGTVSTFSGDDPLIIKESLRTEQYDLKKLNAPDFVNSFPYHKYVFFFFREAAVEHMNSGKAIYSRVARICRGDKGGRFKNDTWTSFLKARLNCSVPGEYPFYFDELQSITHVINISHTTKLVFGVFTTSINAIGGSAICAFQMVDISKVFGGSFKYQESIKSNWLPVPDELVPKKRPGQCVNDSRLLPDDTLEFIKHHFLMESVIPMFGGQPLLKSVSTQYRYSAIAVQPLVNDVYNNTYNILYIGTSDGKVMKAVNMINNKKIETFQIWQSQVLPLGVPVRDIKINQNGNKIVVIGDNFIRLKDINYCSILKNCWDCIGLRDPYCAWNEKSSQCVETNARFASDFKQNVQNVQNERRSVCRSDSFNNSLITQYMDNEIVVHDNAARVNSYVTTETEELISKSFDKEVILSATGSLHMAIVIIVISTLLVGFSVGYFVAKRYQKHAKYLETPFIEQHNQLNRLTDTSVNSHSLMFSPKSNKTVNLDVNIPTIPHQKKDNIDLVNNVNIVNDSTLQKIKKTYI